MNMVCNVTKPAPEKGEQRRQASVPVRECSNKMQQDAEHL
jgi:hypothetical protein